MSIARMGLSYGWQKFHMAVLTLAGPGTQRERLINAYAYHLLQIDGDSLPYDIQARFEKLGDDITREQAQQGEGTVAASVNKMSDQELQAMVEEIIALYDIVARNFGVL